MLAALAARARAAALRGRRPGRARGPGGGRRLGTGPPPAATDNVKPLEGIKVLDLTRVLAGPFATMNLADLGAEVIKVERPGAGDDTRTWGPPFVGTESTYFLSVNRNKKSIAVNIKDPKGVKIIKELAAVCDVFVENYVPGKLSAMGLGYEEIDKIAPHIVYCSITGYGQTGPLSQRAGYDAVASAVSGLMHITGPEDGDPVRPGVAMTDLATGLYACGAIMAGLIQRYKTGKGLFIDCNLLSSQVACLTQVAANYLIGQQEAKRWGTAHGSIVPYQAFKTKDGYLVVGAGNNQQFATVCKILNLPELIDDCKYKTNHLRVQNRKELIKILSARFEEEMTSKWLHLFEGSKVPYGPINNMKNVFEEPQVLHNGLIMEMKHPTVGKISVPGPAVRYSKFKMSEARPPPLLGQHTTHILKEALRYDDRTIAELLRTGVVNQHEAQ
ncbi:succinate--hydroxymethylglutarate CoA-transferase isoform X1 [Pipistrellus kuhlii]|uniref:Succinyl-CoA:glutarate CoA-transferase n=2 Tax=Pipistrellus kuhlii TaxID=59472 RepID=A0A7J7WMG9_PIPKU|nr:succinate--hydroxymethylglutarate CoA-transferase isoform X1 [Pipistrellus kuhlii]KAF6338562.1 succinyl-CoA:glutarate-CoA transferase [Pipistrellus kuhlii]